MLKTRFAILLVLALSFVPAKLLAQDAGQFVILSAQYGIERAHVDVTHRLRELARMDQPFRVTNSIFGADPAPGVVKVLRIYARGPHGREEMFEYREGAVIDGARFKGWRGGEWGSGWSGNWAGGAPVAVPVPVPSADSGMYVIMRAFYGTDRRHVDVTNRLRELARADVRFRMGNSTFGVDPDPGVVKTLRIYGRGPNGREQVFEFREGGVVDGSQFKGWGRGDWGTERWKGGWDSGRGPK